MDDTEDFLNIVGSEYREPTEDEEDRLRCDGCDAFMGEEEGYWDWDYKDLYCDRCARAKGYDDDNERSKRDRGYYEEECNDWCCNGDTGDEEDE